MYFGSANKLESFKEDGRSFQISIATKETDCFPALVLNLLYTSL